MSEALNKREIQATLEDKLAAEKQANEILTQAKERASLYLSLFCHSGCRIIEH